MGKVIYIEDYKKKKSIKTHTRGKVTGSYYYTWVKTYMLTMDKNKGNDDERK